MTEQYEVNWKNYYQILQVSPAAELKDITTGYGRLAKLYRYLLSEKINESQAFLVRITDIDEAYEFLSDSDRRVAYDQVFKAKCRSGEAEAEEPTTEQIVDSIALVAQEVSERRVSVKWRVMAWSMAAQRAIVMAIISLLLIIVGGSSLAFAKPDHILATPFRDAVTTIGEASYSSVGVLEEIRGVVAAYERNIVSMALQSMRVTEGLRVVPAVTVSTNDMAYFPSPEHCLFPDYLDKRFSQFKYTVDTNGIVSVDTSTATTDALLKKIERSLEELSEEQ